MLSPILMKHIMTHLIASLGFGFCRYSTKRMYETLEFHRTISVIHDILWTSYSGIKSKARGDQFSLPRNLLKDLDLIIPGINDCQVHVFNKLIFIIVDPADVKNNIIQKVG